MGVTARRNTQARADVGSILRLAWAPDGTQLAGCGGSGGIVFGRLVDVRLEDRRVHALLQVGWWDDAVEASARVEWGGGQGQANLGTQLIDSFMDVRGSTPLKRFFTTNNIWYKTLEMHTAMHCIRSCLRVRAHKRTHARTRAHTHTHTHTQTNARTPG